MLTNVMLYWLTGTGASSAHLYYESRHSQHWPSPSTAPTGAAVFADDVSIRSIAEQTNTIVHWSAFDEGGQFASLERQDLLVADLRAFVRGLL